jgi:hypothetical protein
LEIDDDQIWLMFGYRGRNGVTRAELHHTGTRLAHDCDDLRTH